MNEAAGIFKQPDKLLKLILYCLMAAFAILIGYAFINGHYFIIHEDEAVYYNSGRLFYETGSVTSSECSQEALAPVWNAGGYGPMYNILYGLTAKVVGFHAYSFIVTNILCIALMSLLVMRSGFEQTTKLFILCSLFSAYVFVAYTFTFFPETMVLLFSVILSIQLNTIYDKTRANESVNSRLFIFLASVLFFALFRVTMVFWAFGLMAFSKSIKDFTKYALFAVICFIPVYMYIKYFTAPLYGTPIGNINKAGLAIAIEHIHTFFRNVVRYFTINPVYDFLIVVIILLAIYNWYITKSRLILCACIISALYFVVLLTLYTPYYFFFDKQSACLFPLLLISLHNTVSPKMKQVILILMLLLAPLAYLKAYSQVKQHRESFVLNNKLQQVNAQLADIKNKIQGTKPRTVLILYHEFDSIQPFYLFMANVPVSTSDGYPVTFTENYSAKKGLSYEANFQTLGRIYVDYFLSKKPLNIDSTSLITQNNLFFLYRNEKKIK